MNRLPPIRNRFLKILLRVQGSYFVLTGIWPLIHIQSFMLVTGPKTDIWLVKMVGLLAVSTGITLLVASRKNIPGAEIIAMVLLSALSFAAIDIYYVLTGRIANIYFFDAGAELIFVILFFIFLCIPARSDKEVA